MDRVKKIGQVVRAICILNHPIRGSNDASSLQIIIPQNEVGRRHDIYVSCISNTHQVCPKNFFVALVATIVETPFPNEEVQPGLKLLAPIDQVFYSLDDLLVPTDDGVNSRVFVSSSYDASTHFESTCADVLSLYERITGHPFDFSKITRHLGDDEN
jgi:Rab GDP dissociation inhibitor